MFLQVAGIEHNIDVTRTPWRLLSPTTHLYNSMFRLTTNDTL